MAVVGIVLSSLVGGKYVGLHTPLVEPENKYWTADEREEDRKLWLKSMSVYRQLMALHYHTMYMYFRGHYGFPKAAVTANGTPIAVFKGTKKNLFKRIKEQIYNPSVNYKKPVSQAHWLNSQHA